MEGYQSVLLDRYDINNNRFFYKISPDIEIFIQNNILYYPKGIIKENIRKSEPQLKNEKGNGEITNKNQFNLFSINPCGLYNVGGVCYTNAALRCFFVVNL